MELFPQISILPFVQKRTKVILDSARQERIEYDRRIANKSCWRFLQVFTPAGVRVMETNEGIEDGK